MRVPLRLAATLLKLRFADISGIARARPAVRCAPLDGGAAQSFETAFPSSLGAAVPVYWVGGCGEPLANPSLGKWTRRLQDAGCTVFIETDGALLRRRIHEFSPDARLYFAIRLHGLRDSHDLHARRDGAFALAIEGIRAAQLSGFLVCAHVPVDGETDLGEVRRLLQLLNKMDLDGVVITSANAEAKVDAALEKSVAEARSLLGSAWWTAFSRLVERSMPAAAPDVSAGSSPERRGAAASVTASVDVSSAPTGVDISEQVSLP
jgi:hypothetical protein